MSDTETGELTAAEVEKHAGIAALADADHVDKPEAGRTRVETFGGDDGDA